MRLWSATVLMIAAVLAAGLAPTPPTAAPPITSPAVRLVAQDGLVQLDPAAQCPVRGDFEGAFTDSSEMSTFLECVLSGVEAWVDASYSGSPLPRAYYFVRSGYQGVDVCDYDSNSLHYCPGTQSVYLGEDAVWEQYSVYGDAAPVVVLAHEVTHHLQFANRMTPAQTPNEQIRYENQADCGAGAFMSYAEKQGFLDRDDDLRDLAGSLVAAAESESSEQSHGTVEERLASFDRGFLSSGTPPLVSCNAFVPENEIIK